LLEVQAAADDVQSSSIICIIVLAAWEVNHGAAKHCTCVNIKYNTSVTKLLC
jgi:hypothetical protein